MVTDTPAANTPYLIKCIATDHVGYLGDDGTTLQGRHNAGTFFILEPTDTVGQYHLKSQKSGKYINAAGVTSGSAITFDNEATTYWTLDQTNANTSLNSWAIRPNGTAGVSLNNFGASDAACPYMKVNVHSHSGQGCDLWTFDDGEILPFEKPQFGGIVWTWNTETGKFDAEGKESTDSPGRANGKGAVLKFENSGTVNASAGDNTSDNGGIWVTGSSSNVTSGLGSWAGSILVEDKAVVSVSYGIDLKGTEPVTSATVWTDGKLTIAGNRTNFSMNDGQNQRWYIGENGVVYTNFNSVSRGNRTWDLQVVVGDMPARADATRSTKQLQKQVMTWGADISAQINSITIWYKDAEGNLTKLDNEKAVTCDATGITVTYEGLGYDEKTPTLPEGKYISVSDTKADFLTPATGADDNAHWYVLTQQRDGESPVYDNGSDDKMKRATAGTTPAGQLIPGNEKYLVRFFQNGDGLYDIQFATGKFVNHDLKTGTYGEGGTFNLYNINGQATHIGWNKPTFADRVDNDGVAADLVYWESGEITEVKNPVGNNDWSIYPVEFITGVPISYTFHSADLSTDFTGSYVAGWAGDNTQLPELAGVAGYTLTNVEFSESGGNYTLTADFAFPFPVSDATTQRPTGIESQLGNSKWYVNDENKMKANNAANTTLNFATQDNFKWNIYPIFSGGTFRFKIQHAKTGLYIPAFTTEQTANTENAVVAENDAGTFYFLPCIGAGKGFSINSEGTVYLTINTSGTNQNIWTWTKSGSHQGSNLTFPNVTITKEDLQAQIAELAGATTFKILEGSIVQGPSEIANPSNINTYIERAKAVDREDIEAMETFLASAYADTIKDYLDDMATYGSLHTCHLEITRPYNTLILPCPSRLPAGIKLYGCSGIGDNKSTLVLNGISGAIVQNVPYIIEAPVGNKYTIIGWLKPHGDTHTSGWLTGVLKDSDEQNPVHVPAGSYALATQKSTGKQAFFRTNGTVRCPQYKCYLTIPSSSSTESVKALYFDNDGLTGIEAIFGADGQEVEIYNLAGQRIQKLQKGVNIVNGRKVLVK